MSTEEKTRVTLRLPIELKSRLDAFLARKELESGIRTDRSSFIARALAKELHRVDKE